AGVLYTGGPKPYGYSGFGELAVFIFFGIASVCGSYFVQTHTVTNEVFFLAVPVGLIAAAILMVNNIRYLETDRTAVNKTLAVRVGHRKACRLYAVTLYSAFAVVILLALLTPITAWISLALLSGALVPSLVRTVNNTVSGPKLNQALAQTGILELAFCFFLSL